MTNEQLVALLKKHPISFGCGALAVALLLTLYFRAGDKEAAETQLADRTALADRYAANIKNSVQLEEHVEAVVAANKEIAARAIRISQLGTNSQYFYKLEGESGVKLIDFRQSTQTAAKSSGAFTPVVFNVSAQGTLPQVLQFLRQLEGGAHFCRVMSASLSSNATARETLTLTLNLELLGTP